MPKNLLDDHEKRLELLQLKSDVYDTKRPNIEDFRGIFSDDEIEYDIRVLARRQQEFNQLALEKGMVPQNELAELFETSLVSLINDKNMLGEEFEMEPTSLYDDVRSGIDAIGIFRYKESDENYLGLGFDITYTPKEETLEKKLHSIKSVIKSKDKLPRVKYFIAKDGERKSILVPKVIIGVSQGQAQKIIRDWESSHKGNRIEIDIGLVKAKIIVEVLLQAQYYYDLASRYGNEEAIESYRILNNYMVELYEQNKELITMHWDEIQNDDVFKLILENTQTS